MANKYTSTQSRASMKYLSKFDEIKLRIPKGQKEELKAAAAAQNKSLNQYILDKLDGQH